MRVFISYHHSKEEVVTHLARYLERHGIDSWYARRDIPAGTSWSSAITKAIGEADAVVLVFCAQADASPAIMNELSVAAQTHKPLFWVRREAIQPDQLGYFLHSSQWIDWLDVRDTTLETLVADLNRIGPGSHLENTLLTSPIAQQQAVESNWPLRIYAFTSEKVASETVARVLFEMARTSSTLVLPTGRAATLVFQAMVDLARSEQFTLDTGVQIINDTETSAVAPDHETSRSRHVRHALLAPLARIGSAPKEEHVHLLTGVFGADDPLKAAKKVFRDNPPGAHAVSVSPTGEILGYEVGTYQDAEDIIHNGPCVLQVASQSQNYIDSDQPTKSIISIGLGTALSAELLLVLLFGSQKTQILGRLVAHPETPGIPATLLRRHSRAVVITTVTQAKSALNQGRYIVEESPEDAANWIVANQ